MCGQDGKYCISSFEVIFKVFNGVMLLMVVIDDGILYELLIGEKVDGRVMKVFDDGVVLFLFDVIWILQVIIFDYDECYGVGIIVFLVIYVFYYVLGYGVFNFISCRMVVKVFGVSFDNMKI